MNRLIQSGYYKVMRRALREALRVSLPLCAAIVVIAFFMLYGSVGPETFLLPYESHIQRSGVQWLFFGALCAQLAWLIWSVYKDFYANGGQKILFMLPMKRRHVLFAYSTAGCLSFLPLWAATVVMLAVMYWPVTAYCASMPVQVLRQYGGTMELPFEIARTNGLFQAWMNSPFFRTLLPPSFAEAVFTIGMTIVIGSAPTYFMLNAKGNKALNGGWTVVWCVWVIYNLLNVGNEITISNFWIRLILPILLLAIMYLAGIKKINKSAGLEEEKRI